MDFSNLGRLHAALADHYMGNEAEASAVIRALEQAAIWYKKARRRVQSGFYDMTNKIGKDYLPLVSRQLEVVEARRAVIERELQARVPVKLSP